MSRIVAFKADDEEAAEIDAYCKDRHFKNIADFARFAIFAYIRQNKAGSHRKHPSTTLEDSSGAGCSAP